MAVMNSCSKSNGDEAETFPLRPSTGTPRACKAFAKATSWHPAPPTIMLLTKVVVPKIPSYRIVDVASAVAPECEQKIVGIRPGKKIHEEMITASDSFNTLDLGRNFAILPSAGHYSMADYCAKSGATLVPPGFAYDSGNNPDFLSVEQLRVLIHEHVLGQMTD